MRIGILGTGTLAVALGTAWTRAGHEVAVAGRSPDRAKAAAERMGTPARAVPWQALHNTLTTAGPLSLIDPTNAVEHGIGHLLTADGRSTAEQIAAWAPGAHVVKAFHLFPATSGQTRPRRDGALGGR